MISGMKLRICNQCQLEILPMEKGHCLLYFGKKSPKYPVFYHFFSLVKVEGKMEFSGLVVVEAF